MSLFLLMVNKCLINGLMFTCYIVKNISPLNKLTFDNKKVIDEHPLFTIHNNV